MFFDVWLAYPLDLSDALEDSSMSSVPDLCVFVS